MKSEIADLIRRVECLSAESACITDDAEDDMDWVKYFLKDVIEKVRQSTIMPDLLADVATTLQCCSDACASRFLNRCSSPCKQPSHAPCFSTVELPFRAVWDPGRGIQVEVFDWNDASCGTDHAALSKTAVDILCRCANLILVLQCCSEPIWVSLHQRLELQLRTNYSCADVRQDGQISSCVIMKAGFALTEVRSNTCGSAAGNCLRLVPAKAPSTNSFPAIANAIHSLADVLVSAADCPTMLVADFLMPAKVLRWTLGHALRSRRPGVPEAPVRLLPLAYPACIYEGIPLPCHRAGLGLYGNSGAAESMRAE